MSQQTLYNLKTFPNIGGFRIKAFEPIDSHYARLITIKGEEKFIGIKNTPNLYSPVVANLMKQYTIENIS